MKKNKTSVVGTVISIILLILIVILSNIGNSSNIFREVMSRGFLSVQNGFFALKNNVFSSQSEKNDIKSLRENNTKLNKENTSLKEKLREYEVVKAENEKLKDFMNLKNKYSDYQTVPAAIIEKSISNYDKTVIINSGEVDGVRVNMPVISEDGLVGYIIEVNKKTAKVQLITDTASTVSGNISTAESSILLKGQLDKNDMVKASYIPTEATVLQGDEVYTSGIGGIYPKGILIGKIKEVINTKNESDRYANVETSVNFNKLINVLVIVNSDLEGYVKKFKSFLILILVFLIIYFLQFNFFTWFNIRGIMPNLFIVFALLVGIFIGQKVGIAVGLFVGIIVDIVIGKQIGFTGIALGVVGYVGELLDKNFDKNNLITLLAMVAIVTFGYEIIQMLYSIVRYGLNFNIFIYLVMIIVEVFFNVLLTIIFYPLIKKIGHYFEEIFKVKRVLTRYY